jgi:ADP-ribose pyrophosphatase YjhB (NUDIX family)
MNPFPLRQNLKFLSSPSQFSSPKHIHTSSRAHQRSSTPPTDTPNAHCSFCGSPHTSVTWPRQCVTCNNITYRNPIPVVVALLPFSFPGMESHNTSSSSHDKFGLLCIRRKIRPSIGGVAFPGGFIDYGETWQCAASREVSEELSLNVEEDKFSIFDVHSTPDASNILIFALSHTVRHASEIADVFQENEEVSQCMIQGRYSSVCLSPHTAPSSPSSPSFPSSSSSPSPLWTPSPRETMCFSLHELVLSRWCDSRMR